MHKSYLPMIDASGILLSLVYMVILIGSLIQISRHMKVGFSAKAITILFLYYYLFFLFTTFIPLLADLPDTKLFAGIITNNTFGRSSLGVQLFYIISYPIRVLSFFKVELFVLFQIFIFILSLMILWKSWQIVLEKNNQDKYSEVNLFLVLSAVYPSFLLYIPVPLREFFALLGFSLVTYGIVNKFYNNKGFILIIIGSAILIFVRPQLIIIAIIFLALSQKNKWLKYISIFGSIFLVPFAFSYLFSWKFTPEFFAYLRNVHFDKYIGIVGYGPAEWKTYFDILEDLPLLFLQFILAPLPILHNQNPTDFFVAFLDGLFSIGLYIGTIYAGIRVSKIYLFIFLISAVIFSIWEFHIIAATRHRMVIVAILLPVASYGMLKMYQDIRAKL